MKTFRDPPTVHAPLATYSHQVEVTGAQRQLYLAGQVGMALDGSIPADPIEQLALAFDNIERNLTAAGMQFADLVKVTTYLVGEVDGDARRALVAARFGTHRPCTTLLYVAALASPQLLVEVDAWASADV
jgi:2-iminobutanoate/2-iminopropanoate deaminase